MCRYRVSFFKNLFSIDGHNHRCLQQSIVIRRAKVPNGPLRPRNVCMSAAVMWLTGGFTRTGLSWRSRHRPNTTWVDPRHLEGLT